MDETREREREGGAQKIREVREMEANEGDERGKDDDETGRRWMWIGREEGGRDV